MDKTIAVSLDEAAAIMGISKDALRKRIKRGTVEAKKDPAGHWQVILDSSDRTDDQDAGPDVSGRVQAIADHIAGMKQEIEFLRKELERRDQLMAMLMQKVPQLEAPKEKMNLFEKIFKRKKSE